MDLNWRGLELAWEPTRRSIGRQAADHWTCPPLTICGPAPVKDPSAHLTATLAQKCVPHVDLGKSCVTEQADLILHGEPDRASPAFNGGERGASLAGRRV